MIVYLVSLWKVLVVPTLPIDGNLMTEYDVKAPKAMFSYFSPHTFSLLVVGTLSAAIEAEQSAKCHQVWWARFEV